MAGSPSWQFHEQMAFAMVARAIRVVFVILILCGSVIALKKGQEYRSLIAEKIRLTNIVGYLPIDDPTKIYVKRIVTDDPRKLSWRVYMPADYAEEERYRAHSSSGSSQSGGTPILARERMIRISFRILSDRRLGVFAQQEGTSRHFNIEVPDGIELTSKDLIKLITDSSAKDVEVRSFDKDQVIYLLDVAWPAEYAKKFEESPPLRMYLNAPILEYGFGSTEAWRIQDEVVQRNN
jgi:hypothetical protein